MEQITKINLEKLYYSNTNEKVCAELGVSKVTLIAMITKAGISPKGKGYQKKYKVV